MSGQTSPAAERGGAAGEHDAAASPLAESTVRRLDGLIADAQRAWRSPNVSVGVMRDGHLALSRHVGLADLEGDRVADDDTQVLIGSVTKTFTALTIMSLRDEGRLDLDDTLSRFLPETKHGRIPLRQMLAHASGLQREPVGRIWESLEAPDAEGVLRGLEEAEQVLPPHHAWHYSNLAYVLLAQVVERVTSRPWGEVVRERVLDPLGMTSTGLTPDETTRAQGYHVDPYAGTARREPMLRLRATAPLGGLWSTVRDMSRYAAHLADPDGSVVSRETLAEMCRPLILTDPETWAGGYGLGWSMVRRGERVLTGHSGGMPGFLTGFLVARGKGVGAFVSSNATSGGAPMRLAGDLVEAVLDLEPVASGPWRPEREHPEFEGILGLWWTEGHRLEYVVRDGALVSRIPGGTASDETRYAPAGRDTWRAVEGRERGELLEVTRGADGRVERMHFATYAVTREPLAFGDLSS